MPIYSVGDNGNKEAVFGTGDINVASGFSIDNNRIGVLTLMNQEPKPIGEKMYHPEKTINYGEASIRMVFPKIESVDVLIRELELVKWYMENN